MERSSSIDSGLKRRRRWEERRKALFEWKEGRGEGGGGTSSSTESEGKVFQGRVLVEKRVGICESRFRRSFSRFWERKERGRKSLEVRKTKWIELASNRISPSSLFPFLLCPPSSTTTQTRTVDLLPLLKLVHHLLLLLELAPPQPLELELVLVLPPS